MIIKNLPTEFEEARPIMQAIESAGFEAYFVGGSVRDTILNKPIHDVDIATSAYPEEIKKIFKRTVDTGIEHGTVMILDHGEGYETTTFRTESGYQDFRRPDEVTFVRSLSEDLQRRDFTINALAMKETGEIIDLFDGLRDLDNQLIRTVGEAYERFHEDALRMMRAVRFASQLNFKIDSATLTGIEENSALLEKIAVERIRVELEKMFMGQTVQAGLDAFIDTDLYRYCPGMDIYRTELQSLTESELPSLDSDTEVWTFITYLFGLQNGSSTHFLKTWKTSNQIITDVLKIQKVIEAILAEQLTPKVVYDAGLERALSAQKIATFFGGTIKNDEIKNIYQNLPIKNKSDLNIDGGQLIKVAHIKPGPLLGKVLFAIENQVVNGDLANKQEELVSFATQMVTEEG